MRGRSHRRAWPIRGRGPGARAWPRREGVAPGLTWPAGSRAGGSRSWAASGRARTAGPAAARSRCCPPASGTGSLGKAGIVAGRTAGIGAGTTGMDGRLPRSPKSHRNPCFPTKNRAEGSEELRGFLGSAPGRAGLSEGGRNSQGFGKGPTGISGRGASPRTPPGTCGTHGHSELPGAPSLRVFPGKAREKPWIPPRIPPAAGEAGTSCSSSSSKETREKG